MRSFQLRRGAAVIAAAMGLAVIVALFVSWRQPEVATSFAVVAVLVGSYGARRHARARLLYGEHRRRQEAEHR